MTQPDRFAAIMKICHLRGSMRNSALRIFQCVSIVRKWRCSARLSDQPHSVWRKPDAAVERWLRDEIAPAYDAHKADPTRAVSLDEGMAQVRARIAKGEVAAK